MKNGYHFNNPMRRQFQKAQIPKVYQVIKSPLQDKNIEKCQDIRDQSKEKKFSQNKNKQKKQLKYFSKMNKRKNKNLQIEQVISLKSQSNENRQAEKFTQQSQNTISNEIKQNQKQRNNKNDQKLTFSLELLNYKSIIQSLSGKKLQQQKQDPTQLGQIISSHNNMNSIIKVKYSSNQQKIFKIKKVILECQLQSQILLLNPEKKLNTQNNQDNIPKIEQQQQISQVQPLQQEDSFSLTYPQQYFESK